MRIRKFAKYYLTSEVATLLHVHTDTVKRWADCGLFGEIKRAGGHEWRLYNKERVHAVLETLKEKL